MAEMDSQTKQELIQRVKQYFVEFLVNFTDRDGNFVYIDQAKRMIDQKLRTLYVKFSDIDQVASDKVSFHPKDLTNAIQQKYLMLRDALNMAVPELLTRLNDESYEEEARKAREQDELKFTVAFHDLRTYKGVRDLRMDSLGRLIAICGTVTRTSDVKPELLVATWRCMACDREVPGVAQQFKVTEPAICPVKNCGNKHSWKLLGTKRTTRWANWQRIRLQENENEVPAGSMPRTMDVLVREDMCEQVKAGDKIMVMGSLIVVPDVGTMMNPSQIKSSERRSLTARSDATYGAPDGVRGLRGTGNQALNYKLCFFGCYLEQNSSWTSSKGDKVMMENIRSEDKLFLSQEDKDRLTAINEHVGPDGKRDTFDYLARAVAPHIHGCVDVKKGILLMLISGVPKKTEEGIKLRGDINVCLLGDPATAKSALLKWTSQFLPRAVFASGKSSTAAGLTASVVTDRDLMEQEKTIEPGALMLADNGICCIDEFELMDEKDMTAIHEAMEQQTITLSKAGIQATLNARAAILASVLPVNTYYQPALPLHKNCNLSPPIMSRFDLFFVMQDVHDEANDEQLAAQVLRQHRGKEDEVMSAPPTQLELQKYIRLSRTFKPIITAEAMKTLMRAYKSLREDRSYQRGAGGVTVRQLESLVRLSEAIARVHLDERVRVEHVKWAFELQVSTLKASAEKNVDLGGEEVEELPVGEPAAGAAPFRRRVKITFAEYDKVGKLLTRRLADCQSREVPVKESDLIAWYMEQIEDTLSTEAEMMEQQNKVHLIIKRMIEKDSVILVYSQSPDPMRPEQRVLIKHPNYKVDDAILEVKA